MEKYQTAVVGGGAAGICAAISTARRGETVVICEKMPQIGKKLLATGNGRCNLLNEELSENYYNLSARKLVKTVFEQVSKEEILTYFKNLGLMTYSREGRIFPVTNQATSVLKVLEMELKRLSVPVELDFNCNSISFYKSSIIVAAADKRKIECEKVIIAGGGKTYPAYGSDGSLFKVARQLGYAIIEPVPVAVPLIVKDKLCQSLQGQKITAAVRPLIDGKTGTEVEGELLFTQYGLSGTAILDISESISLALNREKKNDVAVQIDLVPFIKRAQLREELARRLKADWEASEMLTGILPNRFGLAFKNLFAEGDLTSAVSTLKGLRLKVSATRGWNEAEFTSGGIDVNQANFATLESRIHGGVFFAGEILDVNGCRGGYNLAWAWASGLLAGRGSQPAIQA